MFRNWSVCCCLLLLLQGQYSAANPAAERPVSPLTALPDRGTSDPESGVIFLDGVGDLIAGLVTTGLRAASAFIQTGSEASEKIAIAVGSAAIGPLLNVSRSYNTVRKTVNGAFGNAPTVLTDEKVFKSFSTRVAQGVEPAMKSFAEALDLAVKNRPFRPGSNLSPTGALNILTGSSSSSNSARSNSTSSSNPDDYDIPDYID